VSLEATICLLNDPVLQSGASREWSSEVGIRQRDFPSSCIVIYR
jgi:hypothetical protein